MKVLLRSNYSWVDVVFDPVTNVIKTANPPYKLIHETHVLAIKKDARKRYLKCSVCGEIIKNTPKEIAKHLHKKESNEECFNCRYLTEREGSMIKNVYKLNPDGTYTATKKIKTKLACSRGYYHYPSIQSAEARQNCIYTKCTKETLKPYDGFFIKYPDAFSEIITLDALNEKKWEIKDINTNIGHTYQNKTHKVNAHVNIYGIVEHFSFEYKRRTYYFMYSKKYKKIFWINGGYTDRVPNSNISINTIEKITKLVASAYK